MYGSKPGSHLINHGKYQWETGKAYDQSARKGKMTVESRKGMFLSSEKLKINPPLTPSLCDGV